MLYYVVKGRTEDGTVYYAGHASWADSLRDAKKMTKTEARSVIKRCTSRLVHRLIVLERNTETEKS